MSQQNSISCPVDFVTINENKVRLVAVQVFITSIVILLQPHWIFISVLVFDFFFRTIKLNKFSPFAAIAAGVIKVFSIGFKPVDQGPKRFAAGIGLAFSSAMLGSFFIGSATITLILAATLTVFSFLEGFLSFCAGCYMYTFLMSTFRISQSLKQ